MKVECYAKFCIFLSPVVLVVAGTKQIVSSHLKRNMVSIASLHVQLITDVHDKREFRRTLPSAHDHGSFLRKLQANDACYAAFTALWEDQALNVAHTVYKNNSDVLLASISSNGDSCVSNAAGDVITCDYDEPIDGATEFRSACVAAGGDVVSSSLDTTCDVTLATGAAMTLIFDDPPVLDCIPSTNFDSCTAGVIDTLEAAFDDYNTGLESVLTSEDTSSISCGGSIGIDRVVIEKGGASGNEEDTTGQNVDALSMNEEEDTGDAQSINEEDAVDDNGGSSNTCTAQGNWLSSVIMIGVFLLY